MGCPDWPKCFGYYIPPTDISELQFSEGRQFKQGNFIIWQNALWKARKDLVAGSTVDSADWEKYTKHDYAKFNAAHTWTEYMNRLMGALLGFAAMLMVVISFGRWKRDRPIVLASLAALLLIGFEAWLGALVVASNLAPVKITTHMVTALVIMALMIWVVQRSRPAEMQEAPLVSRGTWLLLLGCVAITLAQIVLGTQVREQVDLVSGLMAEQNRATWIEQLGAIFLVHRSFAWTLLIGNGLVVMRIFKEGEGFPRLRRRATLLAGLLIVEICIGIVLSRMAMPPALQPAHLLLASLMFGLQFAMVLDLRRGRRAVRATPAPPLSALADPVS